MKAPLFILATASALSLATVARAADQPWICYSSTAIQTNTSEINPPVNHTGLAGECPALPYTVPAGYTLVLKGFGIEGYPQLEGGVAIQPFIGRGLAQAAASQFNAATLMTAQGGEYVGTKEVTGVEYDIPAGSSVNVLLQSMQNCGRDGNGAIINCAPVFAWYLRGSLVHN